MLRTLLATSLAAILLPATTILAQPPRTPVIVELFTSEGCSSCPPADAILAQLDHDQPVYNADIIILGEHVDYWDSLGWHDRFSSASFTQRQHDYQFSFKLDDIYTPQAVVNGSTQFNGIDRDGIKNAVLEAAPQTVALQFTSAHILRDSVTFTLADGPATHPELVNVYAALVDPTDTTQVRGGENNSRTLHHAGVVRSLAQVGGAWHIKDLSLHPFSVHLRTPESLNGMRLVVFAQTKRTGPILGAASCLLSAGPVPAPFPANPCPSAAPPITNRQASLR